MADPWTVETTDPQYSLELEYWIDETDIPKIPEASCSMHAPKQLEQFVMAAAKANAAKLGLAGPLLPAEGGDLKAFWVNGRNVPVLGVFYHSQRYVGDRAEPDPRPWELLRYPETTQWTRAALQQKP